MNSKGMTWFFTIIGSLLGGYVPFLWGAGYFSFASIIFSGLGAIVGIWIAFKINQ